MSPSKILFFLCLSFIAGIGFESLIEIPRIFVWGIFILGVVIIVLGISKNYTIVNFLLIVGFCLLVLVLGVLRVQISEFNIANDKLSKLNGKGQIILAGVISDEPDIRDVSQMINVKVGDSTILVTAKRYPEFKYLDKVQLTGKLEEPGATDDFNYKDYLAKDGIYSVIGFPKIEILGKEKYTMLSYLYEKILFVKQNLRQSIQKNFLPPQSSILEGTILGDNGAMSKDLKNKLNITGLRHIIAVSGTHVIILSSIIMSLLLWAGFHKNKAFYIAIILIFTYIILTGLPASGIRAGIMGGLYLWAQKLGRQSMGIRVIVLACAVMLMSNPMLLIYDVGFQLSFLAVMGLIYLDPIFRAIIKKFTKEKAENFIKIISATFAAQIFTLPVMIYNFGNISFASPITNLLVLPIVPALMIAGFLASVAGIFSNILGFVFFVPCWAVLTYFVKVIDIFSQPWMAKSISNIHWAWLFVMYIMISAGSYHLNKKYKIDFL